MPTSGDLWLNIGCGPFLAPYPWVNTDVVRNDKVQPDQVVDYGRGWPWDDNSAERVYCGHVLEHIRRDEVLDFLDEAWRVLAPGAEIMVVGPDMNRTLQRWKEGLDEWVEVVSCLEDDLLLQHTGWEYEGHGHYWNCYEARLMRLLNEAGFDEVTALDITPDNPGPFQTWPVTNLHPRQCAVRAIRPHAE